MEKRTAIRSSTSSPFDWLTNSPGAEDRVPRNGAMPQNGKPGSSAAKPKMAAANGLKISTDKTDYAPGETLLINTTGWKPGAMVTFGLTDVSQPPGKNLAVKGDRTFSITDGGKEDLDGGTNGNVKTSWQLPSRMQARQATWKLTAKDFDQRVCSTTLTTSAPTVSTDKADYKPGETASIITGGFADGSTIEFLVEIVSAAGRDGIYGTADDVVNKGATQRLAGTPWQVTDGSAADLDPAKGKVRTTWLVDADAQNNTLRLTATGFGADQQKGTADDQVAFSSFKDAAGSFSKPYAHWSDEPPPGDWNNNILNDNKSNYFEGEVIPHAFFYGASNSTPLVNGKSYSFNVTYNYYQQNRDAGGFAYMTQYNLSRQPNVFDWATPATTPSGDSVFTNGGGMAAGTNFYTVDADITNVSAVTYTGNGDKDGNVTITFTYTGETTSNGYAAIYYGLYVAEPGQVPDQGLGKGETDGANAWSGGSLQTTVDIGGSGATSLQVAPSAIIAGEISGLKFNDLNGNGIKDTDEPGLAGWTIVLDKDTIANNGNELSVITADGSNNDLDSNGDIDPIGFYYFSVTPGTYYVREINQDGWIQTTPSGNSYGPLVVNTTSQKYLNQDFGNRLALPALTIVKSLTNDDDAVVDTAGEVIEYTITINNTGNTSLTGVTLEDQVDTYPITTLTNPSGDTTNPGVLDVGETWIYSTEYVVTQADIDRDGTLTNVATVDTDQTDPQSSRVSTEVDPSGSLTITKAAAVADGTADQAGDLITYTITLVNTGNISLTGVTLTDKLESYPDTTLTTPSGDTTNPGVLDVGETWTYNTTYTLTQADLDNKGAGDKLLDNIATADTNETDPQSASASVALVNRYAGLVAPTGTTCDQYIQGTAYSHEDYYDGTPGANLNGDVQYADNNAKPGSINSSNPGVFFYYTGLSGFIKGDASGNFTITIDQANKKIAGSDPGGGFPLLKTNEIKLYQINDVGSSIGKIDPLDTCSQVNLVTTGSSKNAEIFEKDGDYTLRFSKATTNAMYVLGIKYDTAALKDSLFAAGNAPTYNYTYETLFNKGTTTAATGVTGEKDDINVSYKFDPNPDALTLNGFATSGGDSLTRNQLDPVIGAAVDYWKAQGIGDANLDKLRHTDVLIGDLGGITLGQTDDINIVLDDDAAGHGWSTTSDGVQADKVDLFSTVVHEFGHVLGYGHDLMGDSLGIGERRLPFDADHAVDDQLQMAVACPGSF